ncbi:Hint domain-containing protein [Palleronia caenipelagi]|uniref:Hedgehog/Intein (Hint) domain-containing protein n=1 Tax=Palleronia caenipelagi TaxID=2489174 RepID=A0A547PI88_9RHOB|nr:Hint domain-containing protein [Palleronia caenipelagi]TRD13865.1 hypothetical protein FEV53_19830 [Palleronia caenipelagi]
MVTRTRDGQFGTQSGDSPNTAFGGTSDNFTVFGGYNITSNIAMGDLADTLTINWADVQGELRMGAGADTVIVDTTADPQDTTQLTTIGYSNPDTAFTMAGGNDSVTILGNVRINGDIDLSSGTDTLSFNTTDILTGDVFAGDGSDVLTFDAGTITGQIDADAYASGTLPSAGDDNDILTFNGGVLNGPINGNIGLDTININGGQFDSTLSGGDGSDSFTVTGWAAGTNLVIDGNEDGDSSDVDTLDLSGLTGVLAIDPGNPENGVFTRSNGDTLTFTNIENITPPVCFTRGTLIATINGDCPIEDLRVGDLVATIDNGYEPIKWIGSRLLEEQRLRDNPDFIPVIIPKGALGAGLPTNDLILSPQHRILVSSTIVQRMFDTREVLVAVKHLVGSFGIRRLDLDGDVEYYHILMDNHEIVLSNGAYSETFFPGKEALKSVSSAARREILSIFPELASERPAQKIALARKISKRRKAERLVERHAKNSNSLYQSFS